MRSLISILHKYSLLLLLILVVTLEFWRLGEHPINSFDEARFGTNAFEMMQNGDLLNLHYQGQPDAWVARPPLKAWLIILGYKIFGFNEWGLRFSSGVFLLAFFFLIFKWFELYLGKTRALLGCLFLLSVKGIIGFHVGRNGDMDAELLAFQAGFLYFFSLYLHFGKPKAILLAGLFLGLAFWLKTVAAFFYLPGIALYLVFSKRLTGVLKDKYAWYACLVLLASIAAWILAVALLGTRYENTRYAGNNAIETMLVYDVWMRFTASHFDGHPVVPSYDFFFTNLDSRFNVWNYFFYLGVGIFFYQQWKMRVPAPYHKLLPLCAWIILPVFVLLTVGMHKLDWYSAPIFPILTLFVLFAIDRLILKFEWFKWLILSTLCFTLVRHALYIDSESSLQNEASFVKQEAGQFQTADTLWVIDDVPQSVYLNLLWTGKPVKISPNAETFSSISNRTGFSYSHAVANKPHVQEIAQYNDDRLGIFLHLVKSRD